MSDTGVGMGLDVLAHLFEPFFTTKEQGKGTGLGLATVYGVVKQSAGFIAVESLPGQGTSFQIHFPCAVEDNMPEPTPEKKPHSVSGTETILVVEDQQEVRRVVCTALRSHGYRVLEAIDGPSALSLLRGGAERVALLLTDVVMPDMSGRQLADRAVETAGSLRVLYMSGYADDAIVSRGVLEPGIDFLSKPFDVTQLLRSVRALLDRPSQGEAEMMNQRSR